MKTVVKSVNTTRKIYLRQEFNLYICLGHFNFLMVKYRRYTSAYFRGAILLEFETAPLLEDENLM